jgi:hypothetical protein
MPMTSTLEAIPPCTHLEAILMTTTLEAMSPCTRIEAIPIYPTRSYV